MYGLIIQEDQWKHHGTSGEKASVNGILNFSILDGWWAEGYNQKNGWSIGTNAVYDSYDEQDDADSQSMYNTLENKIIPMYYNKVHGVPNEWTQMMKNSIISTGGEYSTARMIVDYTNQLYMPLCNITNKYFNNLDTVAEYNQMKKELLTNWEDIQITQSNNLDNITVDAGNNIEVFCKVILPNVKVENIETQAYYGKITDNGIIEDISIIPMELISSDTESKTYEFKAKIELKNGGNYGYTFRVMPKHEMLLDSANLNMIKWITK